MLKTSIIVFSWQITYNIMGRIALESQWYKPSRNVELKEGADQRRGWWVWAVPLHSIIYKRGLGNKQKPQSTYFQKQWAAVSSHVLLMSVAPHWWPAPMSCRLACHGHSPSIAVSLPWTIRSVVEDAGNGMFEDDILIPHPEKETHSSLFSWQQRKVSWLVLKEVTEKILCSVTL